VGSITSRPLVHNVARIDGDPLRPMLQLGWLVASATVAFGQIRRRAKSEKATSGGGELECRAGPGWDARGEAGG